MHKKSFYALDICIKMRYTSSRSMENKSNDDFEEENKMKKLFALILALAMMLTAAAASAESLKVGLNAEFAPFEYVDDDGKITGFDVELITAIAEKMGMEVEIENMYFDGLLGALTSKMVDCLCTGMTITEERKASVDFRFLGRRGDRSASTRGGPLPTGQHLICFLKVFELLGGPLLELLVRSKPIRMQNLSRLAVCCLHFLGRGVRRKPQQAQCLVAVHLPPSIMTLHCTTREVNNMKAPCKKHISVGHRQLEFGFA